jgi:nitrogen fixation protein FixH
MSLTATRPGFVLKGWHVLVALLAFFGADIAINTAYIMTAYQTFPGETSVTPYEDGLAYDSALQQLHDQEVRGWRISTAAAAAGQVQVQAFDRSRAPLRGLKVSGDLIRPATEIGKRSVTFRETGPGLYTAATGPLDGAWDIDLTLVDTKGEKALATRRLVLP